MDIDAFKAGSIMYMHKYFKYEESKAWEFHLKIYIGLLGLIFQASSTK